jgi:hypothetical protein
MDLFTILRRRLAALSDEEIAEKKLYLSSFIHSVERLVERYRLIVKKYFFEQD